MWVGQEGLPGGGVQARIGRLQMVRASRVEKEGWMTVKAPSASEKLEARLVVLGSVQSLGFLSLFLSRWLEAWRV